MWSFKITIPVENNMNGSKYIWSVPKPKEIIDPISKVKLIIKTIIKKYLIIFFIFIF